MAAKIYGVFCTKGGTGKSTTCANLGAILADMGQRVLLIDSDTQQTLSRWYPITEQAPFGLTQLYKSASAQSCISKTNIPNCDIVINDDPDKDSAICHFVRESFYHYLHLSKALNALRDDYDYILIDTQGAKGLIQETVLIASDVVLSPVQPNGIDAKEFIKNTVVAYKGLLPQDGFPSLRGNAPTPPLRVLVNKADKTRMTDEIVNLLRKNFDAEADHHISVLNTQIPNLSAYKEAGTARMPVHRYEKSRNGPTLAALHIMTKLIHELEPKLIDIHPVWGN